MGDPAPAAGAGAEAEPVARAQQFRPGTDGGGDFFLSALGLLPAADAAAVKRTPEKKPHLLYNRRGTPQRIRKKNRLYFDDDHVSGRHARGSPRKPQSSAPDQPPPEDAAQAQSAPQQPAAAAAARDAPSAPATRSQDALRARDEPAASRDLTELMSASPRKQAADPNVSPRKRARDAAALSYSESSDAPGSPSTRSRGNPSSPNTRSRVRVVSPSGRLRDRSPSSKSHLQASPSTRNRRQLASPLKRSRIMSASPNTRSRDRPTSPGSRRGDVSSPGRKSAGVPVSPGMRARDRLRAAGGGGRRDLFPPSPKKRREPADGEDSPRPAASPAAAAAPTPAATPPASASAPQQTETLDSVQRQMDAHQLGLRLRNLLKLPKAHKFVCYEWFYSTIDECLLTGSNDFLICLREQFPRLRSTLLTRAQWCKVRRHMGKPRRCSPAFFAEERSVLRGLRQKVRTLQAQQGRTFDRAFLKNLPEDVPVQLSIGTRCTARLRRPVDGLFTGIIQAVDTLNSTYRIKFMKPGLESQSVPDYEVRALGAVDTVPTVSFGRTGGPRPSAAYSTPPRFPPLPLHSPLANDPLMSGGPAAAARDHAHLPHLLDDQSDINGYPVPFLTHLVHMNKILAAKRERVARLESLNTDAERRQLYGQPISEQFQRGYARLVLQLESVNAQLRKVTTDVQVGCQQLMPESGLVPAVLPTHMKTLCDQEAARQLQVMSELRAQRGQSVPTGAGLTQLICRLTSLLLQIKHFADNEMNPFELSSLEETMREIGAALRPSSQPAFQDRVQVHVQHLQTGLTRRWNGRSGGGGGGGGRRRTAH